MKFLIDQTATAELHPCMVNRCDNRAVARSKIRSRALRFGRARSAPAISRSTREDDFLWIFCLPSSLLAAWIEKVEGGQFLSKAK